MNIDETTRRGFACATAGLGALTVVYGDFAPVWGTVPASVAGRGVLTGAVGGLLLVASLAVGVRRTARAGALLVSCYLAACVLIRLAPVLATPRSFIAWYGVAEALAPLAASVLVWISAGAGSPLEAASLAPIARALRAAFGASCVLFGGAHFAYADLTARMVPGWLPSHLVVAHATGVAHAAAGIALLSGRRARLAAYAEALMMTAFGLFVWVPAFFQQPVPDWATPAQNRWSELSVTGLLAASAYVVGASLRGRRGHLSRAPGSPGTP